MTSHAGPDLAESLRRAGFRGALMPHEPLAPHTTWRIGGPAELLAHPADRADVALAVGWAHSAGVAWRVLGNGSNLLVRDEGVAGLVLRIRKALDDVRIEGTRLTAGAGASFPAVVNLAHEAGCQPHESPEIQARFRRVDPLEELAGQRLDPVVLEPAPLLRQAPVPREDPSVAASRQP